MKQAEYYELYELERKLIKSPFRNDEHFLKSIIDENFLEYDCTGKRWERDELIKALVNSTYDKIEAENFEAQLICNDTYLITFKTIKQFENKKITSIRSSIWKKKEEQWRLLFHQCTFSK